MNLTKYLHDHYGICQCNAGMFCPGARCHSFKSFDAKTYEELRIAQERIYDQRKPPKAEKKDGRASD